jgi:putative ABC transport system permease protein
MISGRDFTSTDTAGSQPVAVIDAHLARKYFGDRNPIGAQILAPVVNRANPALETYSPVTVVGVVSDVRPFGEQDGPRLYVPQAQSPSEFAQLFIRMRTPDPRLRSHVAAAVAAANPTVALDEFGSLQDRIAQIVAPEKATAAVAAIVAFIALLLALAGIYAIVVYSAHQQRHEFGIRLALGAERRDIVRVVLRTALAIAAFGIVGGIVLAALGSRLISTQIVNVSPFDLLTFAASIVVVAASVLFASLLPAFEASRLDPAVTLRYE